MRWYGIRATIERWGAVGFVVAFAIFGCFLAYCYRPPSDEELGTFTAEAVERTLRREVRGAVTIVLDSGSLSGLPGTLGRRFEEKVRTIGPKVVIKNIGSSRDDRLAPLDNPVVARLSSDPDTKYVILVFDLVEEAGYWRLGWLRVQDPEEPTAKTYYGKFRCGRWMDQGVGEVYFLR